MPRRPLLLLTLLLVACSPLRGCVESQFRLAPDSRLPAWFSLPADRKRSDLTVTLTYWTYGDNAEFELIDPRSGATIRDVSGPSCWHPATRYTQKPDGRFEPPGGPEYVIATVRGVTDVVEHDEQNDVFRMAEDEAILREAKESIARGECRHEP
jgi:hypothetical protein